MSKKVLIVPTKEEEKEWKEILYNTLVFLATEREDFMPDKGDSFETLKDSFFSWASEYNDGYFTEMDEADTDRYCAYITQEFIRWDDYRKFNDLYYAEIDEETVNFIKGIYEIEPLRHDVKNCYETISKVRTIGDLINLRYKENQMKIPVEDIGVMINGKEQDITLKEAVEEFSLPINEPVIWFKCSNFNQIDNPKYDIKKDYFSFELYDEGYEFEPELIISDLTMEEFEDMFPEKEEEEEKEI